MREELKKLYGRRLRFEALVERFGSKSSFRGPPVETVLLRDVRRIDTGELVTDHLWWARGKWAEALEPGQVIEFDARVDSYLKGYFGRREEVYAPPQRDYRLVRPTRVAVRHYISK